ncbi:hypothetical protein DQ04_01151190 [Trypanosoma grayi]|uniref:hypothetical protein n=1 Tax=Trypanosoma grayi TaxID=71804 RepID=UPI0004F43AFE|nr:hypothetical protein DQ04_01151190 [Trypanosoma grayi]KEG13212.1 hypothetical protein DQ04_01151190 [Trypanosoma grayi]
MTDGSLSKAAYERLRRYGGPCAVVDPLLAVLMRLRRLEDSVLDVLESFGVSSEQVKSCGRACQEPLEKIRPPFVANDDASCDTVDPVDRYIVAHASRGRRASDVTCDVTQEEREACSSAILRWVDEASPLDATPLLDSSRAELITRLSKAAESRGGAAPPRVKKRRRSTETPGGREGFLHRHWGHYAAQLKSAYRSERSVVNAVCATDIGKSLCSHAKWVEVAQCRASGFTTPAAMALSQNCKDLTLAKDALAARQRGIVGLLSSLEDAVDEYTEEARNIADREETLWCNVRLAECEIRALLHLAHRVKGIVAAL